MRRLFIYTFIYLTAIIVYGCSGDQEITEENVDTEEVPFSAAFIENSEDYPEKNLAPEDSFGTGNIESSRANAITRAVENVSPAVVSIMVTAPVRRYDNTIDDFFRYFFGDQLPRENTNIGSGFVITEDGLVVTNQHVVGNDPSEIVISTKDGSMFQAKLIGSDELTDIALLKIESDETFPFVEFSNSDDVLVGEWAIALGNPFGLFDDGNPTVTVGVVSAKNRDFRANPNNPRVYIDMIQTDAAINRGNSGGPLLNSRGEVIGINTFIYTGGTSAGFVGLSFAIPSNRIERIITQLLTSGVVVLDYDPGMEFTSMTEQLVYRYRLPYVQGLLVTSVNKGGPAFECGIMPGDVIVRIGEERVVSEMHAWALLRDYDVGDDMEVELIRENQLYKTEMKLRHKVNAAD